MTLYQKEILASKMIQDDPDVTIGSYWEFIKYSFPPVEISIPEPAVLPIQKRMYNRKVQLKDPCPFTRPAAKYDNRSQEDIYNQYAPIR